MKVLAVIPGNPHHLSGMVFAKRQVEELQKQGVEVEIYWLENRSLSPSLFKEFFKLKRVIEDVNPQILHAHYGTITGFLCSLFFWKLPIVTCFRGSDINIDPGVSFPRNVIGPFLSQLSVLFSKKVICVSQKLKDKLWWGKSKAYVITDGVDLEQFHPMDKVECRQKLNLPLDRPTLIFNVSKQPMTKGLPFTEKVVENLKRSIPDLNFIKFEGNVPPEHIPLYLNAGDLLFMTSLSEGSPVIVKESLACNLPILTVDVGDAKELTQGVKNCHLLPRNEDLFEEHAKELLFHPTKSNGTDFQERFGAKIKAKEIKELFSSIAF